MDKLEILYFGQWGVLNPLMAASYHNIVAAIREFGTHQREIQNLVYIAYQQTNRNKQALQKSCYRLLEENFAKVFINKIHARRKNSYTSYVSSTTNQVIAFNSASQNAKAWFNGWISYYWIFDACLFNGQLWKSIYSPSLLHKWNKITTQ